MMAAKDGNLRKSLNFNVGILGHIDSGKTSLAKALSSVASTASFDKNPQSRERGITLDLGFSSFSMPLPPHLEGQGYEDVQVTLVDCPGHASLIRTIIGGAQIIDFMILVVDITKGIQTQTAECLVIGEITCDHLMVVLNKIDLIEEPKREAVISKMTKRISRTLQPTRFSGALIVPVAAKPGGPDTTPPDGPNITPPTHEALGVDNLVQVLSSVVFVPRRSSGGTFVFSVDHCFPIRGQGTVMTGTILSGSVAVNDTIEIPFLKVTKKVKSMQMFHTPVQSAMQGDRVGICVTQFDPKQVERCLVATPGYLPTLLVTIGHETVMGKVTFFGGELQEGKQFDFDREYPFLEELMESNTQAVSEGKGGLPAGDEDKSKETQLGQTGEGKGQYALLQFEKPVTSLPDAIVIGSRLDTDVHSNVCRIAFHGILVYAITDKDYASSVLPKLKVFKVKFREGIVERLHDERSVIGKNLFKKETNIQPFIGLKVQLSTGEEGVIDSSFGTSGKFRVSIPGLMEETQQILSTAGKKKSRGKAAGGGEAVASNPVRITLTFRKFIFDTQKRMLQ